jgi:Ca2+-binding RTX toxin-like protein
MPHPIRTIIAGAAVFASLAGASDAAASELFRDGDALVLRGSPGETNYFGTSRDAWTNSPNKVHFYDRTNYPMAVDPSLGCETSSVSGGRFADCPLNGITKVRLEGGDQVDTLTMNPYGYPLPGNAVTLDGGSGDDQVEAPNDAPPLTILGGEGDDKIKGGTGPDVVDGGPGNDEVDGRNGADVVRGGPGDDLVKGGTDVGPDVIDGGPGTDRNEGDWGAATALSVTFDGVANDGRPGENDNVLSLEAIKTTAVATLVAGDAADSPVRFEVYRTIAGGSRLVGSRFDDYLRTDHYDDVIEAGAGADLVDAGFGNDTITLGPGQDTLYADGGPNACESGDCPLPYGNDTINAQDGEKDTVDCSVGTDRVTADSIDVLSGCEVVNGVTTGGGGTPPGGGGTPARATCRVPKVKAGTTLRAAKRKLKRAKCTVKVKRVRSRRAKGRVVKLTKKGRIVTVHVSRGR